MHSADTKVRACPDRRAGELREDSEMSVEIDQDLIDESKDERVCGNCAEILSYYEVEELCGLCQCCHDKKLRQALDSIA